MERCAFGYDPSFLGAGIELSPLADYAVEWFDVAPDGGRCYLHNLAGLLGRQFLGGGAGPRSLLMDHRDAVEAYRRMVFNCLGGNMADHAKNFSFDLGSSTGENGLSDKKIRVVQERIRGNVNRIRKRS